MPLPTLIIDDNRRYTSMLKERLEQNDCRVEHILKSQPGLEHLRSIDPNHYRLIITDITMETQVSGISLTWRIRRLGFKGCLIIYSTGFNYRLPLWLSALLFKMLGADGLIPKNGLLKGEPRIFALSRHPLLSLVRKAINQR